VTIFRNKAENCFIFYLCSSK